MSEKKLGIWNEVVEKVNEGSRKEFWGRRAKGKYKRIA